MEKRDGLRNLHVLAAESNLSQAVQRGQRCVLHVLRLHWHNVHVETGVAVCPPAQWTLHLSSGHSMGSVTGRGSAQQPRADPAG